MDAGQNDCLHRRLVRPRRVPCLHAKLADERPVIDTTVRTSKFSATAFTRQARFSPSHTTTSRHTAACLCANANQMKAQRRDRLLLSLTAGPQPHPRGVVPLRLGTRGRLSPARPMEHSLDSDIAREREPGSLLGRRQDGGVLAAGCRGDWQARLDRAQLILLGA